MSPNQPQGVSGPQGVSNTQMQMPQSVPDPSQGAPVDPSQQQVPQAAPPKAPSLVPSDVAKLLAEAINNAKMQAADGLVRYLGDPRGSVSVKNADMLRVWRKRNPDVDPLYEKLINKKSDDEITNMMYPARRALIRYGRRTYTEQVQFAERMADLNKDPKYHDLGVVEDDEDDEYTPPQSRFPSRGEETYKETLRKKREEERNPTEDQK